MRQNNKVTCIFDEIDCQRVIDIYVIEIYVIDMPQFCLFNKC